jgi:teichuronic acid biosynthesis glycosyltransferase TuaC
MEAPMRVLMITSEWPAPGRPRTTYFIKRQAEFLSAAGVDITVFQFRGAKRPDYYLRAWLRLRRQLSRGRYDLVHAQFGQSGLLALPKQIPLVVTFRGSDLLGIVGRDGKYTWASKIGKWASRVVARAANAVIVVSEHMKASLPNGVRPLVLPSGLDFNLFRPIPRAEARARLGLPSDRRLVLFAGNPDTARKRFGLARAAIAALTAGQPPGAATVELVVAWGAPHEEMPLYMGAADALLFTSMQEGSPNVVKEALACNLPVVSVAVGDVPERLRGVSNCELVDDERPEALALALGRVLAAGHRSDGREHVQQLNEQHITQRVIDLYRSVLGRARTGSATDWRVEPHPARQLTSTI